MRDWSPRDRGLASALIVLESSTHLCGHDLERSTHPDMGGGWFEVDDSTVCEACAALEKWQNDGPHEPGVIPVVKDVRPDSKPLPPRRTVKRRGQAAGE